MTINEIIERELADELAIERALYEACKAALPYLENFKSATALEQVRNAIKMYEESQWPD